jgi:hypothetical protein
MDAASDGTGARGLAATSVNAQIREIAESLAADGDDHEYTFFCECGCLKPVPLTLTAFIADGAFLDGHHFAKPSQQDGAAIEVR